jgi:hypothetical protein
LRGERLEWFRVASHLKIPVAALKQQLSFLEFLEWVEYLRQERRENTKQDYYLAQIAAEIAKDHVKNPKKVKLSDYLLVIKEVTPEQARMQKSKSAWAAALHVKLERN